MSMRLTSDDYAALDRSFISRDIANAAGLYRVTSIDGRDLVGRKGAGDYAGIVFPYRYPGDKRSVLDQLRLDNPPLDLANGKPQQKYLIPRNSRNRLYFPPCPPVLVTKTEIPLVVTEGAKKVLSLWRMSLGVTNGTGQSPFLPVGLNGVWGFRGTVGLQSNAKGQRVPEKDILPDLLALPLTGRRVTILFDANVATNPHVRYARRDLARELIRLGADVFLADLPALPEVNGIDDFLGLHGAEKGMIIIESARKYEWRSDLLKNTKGQTAACLANAILALRHAPEWVGVLTFNEFSLSVHAVRPTPWNFTGRWTDAQTIAACNWLQHEGIRIRTGESFDAVVLVARDQTFHPVRDYLHSLTWDGQKRIDTWLSKYLGASISKPEEGFTNSKEKSAWELADKLIREIGPKFLISAVARVEKPGCKVDHVLILEGEQGIGKSRTIQILGEPWSIDNIAELNTKDAQLALFGVWMVELSELDAMGRAEVSRIKAFITCQSDHVRPPYGRITEDIPRQCVFVGTVNQHEYLKDETGGRRFWPVQCGQIDTEALKRDRDQLWAEALVRFSAGETWWLTDQALIKAAATEQDFRYLTDSWEPAIHSWLKDRIIPVTTADVLRDAIGKSPGQWTRGDEIRVGSILRRLQWEPKRPRDESNSRRRVYERRSNGPKDQGTS